jgi:hypothetical protein
MRRSPRNVIFAANIDANFCCDGAPIGTSNFLYAGKVRLASHLQRKAARRAANSGQNSVNEPQKT